MKVICISAKARNGKDTVAEMMKETLEDSGKSVLIAHYADLVKYIAKTFFDWDGEKDERGREILQYIGTDVVRAKIPDFWVNFIISILDLFGNNWDFVLIPDCRFKNECESLIKHGFDTKIIRVDRPNFMSPLTEEQQKHPSETSMDGYDFDYTIVNDGDLNDLRKKADRLAREMLCGK